MGSATGSESYIAILKQSPSTPHTIPSTPVMQKVNFVSEDLAKDVVKSQSNHVRDDRMNSGQNITGINILGGYEFELTYENSLLDELLLSFLWAESWTAGGDLEEFAKNGKFYQPYFIERGHTDVGQYFKYVGMGCNVMALSFPDQSEVTGSFQFMGLSGQLDQAVETGATYTALTENPVISAVTNIPTISIGGVAQTGCRLKEWDMEVNNNLTAKTGPGTLGACETNAHRFTLTGKMTLYFEDNTMYDYFESGGKFALSWTLTDDDANSYKFTIPSIQLDTNKINTTGADDDVMEDATYTASYDSTLGCMIMIERTSLQIP